MGGLTIDSRKDKKWRTGPRETSAWREVKIKRFEKGILRLRPLSRVKGILRTEKIKKCKGKDVHTNSCYKGIVKETSLM